MLFAGEATSARHWSTMHGARLSGLREAERILKRVRDREQIGREIDRIANGSNGASSPPPPPRSPRSSNGTLEKRRLLKIASSSPRGEAADDTF